MAKVDLDKLGFEGVDESEVVAALNALAKQREQRAKQRERSKNDPEAKAKASARAERQRIKDTILKHKAVQAGIVVTDDEINAYLASKA